MAAQKTPSFLKTQSFSNTPNPSKASPMSVSPKSTNTKDYSPMSTSPANNDKVYKHYTSINDLRPVEEDYTQAMILLGSDKPLQVSYPGDNENPIDVDATSNFSNLASKSTFPTQRSKRVFENQFGEYQSAKRSKEESNFLVDTTTSNNTDTNFSVPNSSRTPSTSTPQAESEKEKEEEEMSDDTPLRNFIPKGVHRTYWKFDKYVVSTSKATDEKMGPDYVAPTSEATPAATSSEQVYTESETNSEVIPYSSMFQTKSCSSNWNWFKNRGVRGEKVIDLTSFSKNGLVDFLSSRNILSSVSGKNPYCEKVIKVFYANLMLAVKDTTSKKFGKVYLYNKVYNFTPNIINSTLGIIISKREPQPNPTMEELNSMIKYLTGNLITVWAPRSPMSKLTALFATLHKLAIYNWLPSLNETLVTFDQASLLFKFGRNQKVDLGTIIFNHAVNLAEKQSNSALPYPSLIFQILLNQGFKTPKG
ncbi:hypothetical protein RND71_038231 [Anisodus tanguticus]|uniref:Putative plant transposon protein domain-containing protein n=1 Tax=Anisodus tanguticus TaxID=243964 RepID=A0AAE1UZA3_9SOLA|nr:hypothetical protein RND71_038231 [Anisodus tanguticus]